MSCDWQLQLLPLLASSLEFGSAAASALTVLLKMGSWLPVDEFNVKVLLYHPLIGLTSQILEILIYVPLQNYLFMLYHEKSYYIYMQFNNSIFR